MLTEEMRAKLVEIALHARQWAYAPYSNYPVGAALLTGSGKIYEGVNVENAAYPSGMCAERIAVFKAISEGESEFAAIAVVTANGGPPCGGCRQVLAEFSSDLLVIIADEKGNVRHELSLRELLPAAFDPKFLHTKPPGSK